MSGGKVTSAFSVPFYSADISGKELEAVQAEMSFAIEQIDFQYNPGWGNTHYLSDITFSKDVISEYELHEFSNQLDYHIDQFCQILSYPTPNYSLTSWFTLFKKGNYAHEHDHIASKIHMSGVYYYKTSGIDGDIAFHNPNRLIKSTDCFSRPENVEIRQSPEVGRLFIFPPWLSHRVYPNQTNDDRISLAFNVNFEISY